VKPDQPTVSVLLRGVRLPRNAARPLPDADVDAVLAAIWHLDQLSDLREIVQPFAR
jgi:hypothetical protein